jgi:hypothetical protein
MMVALLLISASEGLATLMETSPKGQRAPSTRRSVRANLGSWNGCAGRLMTVDRRARYPSKPLNAGFESIPASKRSGNGETDESCAQSSKEADGYVHAGEEAGAVFSEPERLVSEGAVGGQAAAEPRAEHTHRDEPQRYQSRCFLHGRSPAPPHTGDLRRVWRMMASSACLGIALGGEF